MSWVLAGEVVPMVWMNQRTTCGECTRASLESGSGFWFIARDAAGNDKVSSRPGVELIRHGRALDDVVRGGALVHIA